MEELVAQIQGSWDSLQSFLLSLLQRWRFYQLLILLALFATAHLLSLWIHPRLQKWMRTLEGMKASQLRFLIVVTRRTRGITFLILASITYVVMQTITWPSRSYLIGLAITLVAAWIFVAIASRLIRNTAMRFVVKWGAWTLVTFSILGISDEVWSILDSISLNFGDTRLSLYLVLKAVLTLAIMLVVATWLSRNVQQKLEQNEDLSPSLRVLTGKLLYVILFAIAIFIALQSVGFDLTSLTVLSGAIGLGLGFGLQKVVSNLVSGVIVLLDKSIKPGDVISLGETFGWVSELNARFVAVITRDGKEFLIPNEDLITNQVVNWTHSSDLVRLEIPFGVSYASDPHEVRKFAREAASTVGRVVSAPQPICHICGFGDSSIDFLLRFWIKDPSGGLTNVRGDVYLALWDVLKREDIEIPFPRRDVTVLSGGGLVAPESNK